MKQKHELLVWTEKREGLNNIVAYPLNESARLACMLVKRNYLTQNELVIFQKLGFTLKKEDITKE